MKFGTGTWIYGTVGDRYLLSGYRQGLDILERIERIAGIEDVSGIEMIYPADFGPGLEAVGEAIEAAGLDCYIVGVDLTGDPKWRYGTYSSKDAGIRREAVELTKETIDTAVSLGAERINIWPGEDGHDYPFQADYTHSWNWFKECMVEVAEHNPDISLCIEYKLREPRVRSLISTTDRAVMMSNETGMDNVGVTIDIGHALQAGENVAESIALLSRNGRLFHVHLNDNYRGWDDDMVLGSVHMVELLEMAYTLRTVDYTGWLSVDIYPYREDPGPAVAESVAYVKGLNAALDRIGMDVIAEALKGDDPIPLLSRIREATLG